MLIPKTKAAAGPELVGSPDSATLQPRKFRNTATTESPDLTWTRMNMRSGPRGEVKDHFTAHDQNHKLYVKVVMIVHAAFGYVAGDFINGASHQNKKYHIKISGNNMLTQRYDKGTRSVFATSEKAIPLLGNRRFDIQVVFQHLEDVPGGAAFLDSQGGDKGIVVSMISLNNRGLNSSPNSRASIFKSENSQNSTTSSASSGSNDNGSKVMPISHGGSSAFKSNIISGTVNGIFSFVALSDNTCQITMIQTVNLGGLAPAAISNIATRHLIFNIECKPPLLLFFQTSST
jgi:hypothetical protein